MPDPIIIRDPSICGGEPTIRGTRVTTATAYADVLCCGPYTSPAVGGAGGGPPTRNQLESLDGNCHR